MGLGDEDGAHGSAVSLKSSGRGRSCGRTKQSCPCVWGVEAHVARHERGVPTRPARGGKALDSERPAIPQLSLRLVGVSRRRCCQLHASGHRLQVVISETYDEHESVLGMAYLMAAWSAWRQHRRTHTRQHQRRTHATRGGGALGRPHSIHSDDTWEMLPLLVRATKVMVSWRMSFGHVLVVVFSVHVFFTHCLCAMMLSAHYESIGGT